MTVSNTAGGYWVRDKPDGSRTWGNRRNRPEFLAALGDYYGKVHGRELHPCTTHYPITEYVSYKTLLLHYPDAFSGIVMCMRADRAASRWCYDCKKCFEYAVFGLAHGHVDATFDYDAALGRSPYVQSLTTHALANPARTVHGNVAWAAVVGTRTHFAALCHALHLADAALLQGRVGVAALANLAVLREAFGSTTFPAVDVMHRAAVEASGPAPARAVAQIAAEHTPVVDDLPGVLLLGNEVANFAHGSAAPHPSVDTILAGSATSA